MSRIKHVWFAIAVILFAVFSISGAVHRYYPLAAQVYDLDYRGDFVTLVDAGGNAWGFTGCEDWMRGDIAALLMDSKGTGNISDDEIIMVRYAGNVY